jgi:hypothetical protein
MWGIPPVRDAKLEHWTEGGVMDAREFLWKIVVPNYAEFYKSPNDIRLLWNALVSMNTVPEFLALHRQA